MIVQIFKAKEVLYFSIVISDGDGGNGGGGVGGSNHTGSNTDSNIYSCTSVAVIT